MNLSIPELAEVAKIEQGKTTQPIRILFNKPDPSLRGGPPTHLPILANALASLVEVHSFAYGRKSDSETLPEKVLGRAQDLARIRRLCRAVRPDLMHHNSAFDYRAVIRDAPLVLLAKRQNIPVFIKIHGSMPEAFLSGSAVFNQARQIVLRNAERIGVLSVIEKEEFEQAFPYLQGRVTVVKNVIDAKFFAVRRQEAERPTILFLSRFVRRKGLFDLLHAIPLVLQRVPTAEFVFTGEGEDARAFEREVSAMDLGQAVRRLPHLNSQQSLPAYAAAWMVVLPTYFPEGMPMVIAEAMAVGVPIVSTPTRFSRSCMTEGVHALYHQPGNVHAIAERILQLCADRALRERMSAANRTFASDRFTSDRVAQEYLEIYNDILSHRNNSLSKPGP